MKELSTSPLSSKFSVTVDSLAFISLLGSIALLPIAFVPFWGVPIEVSKQFFLMIGCLVTLVFWLAARIESRNLKLPKTSIVGLVGFPVLATFFATLVSANFYKSLSGAHYDFGTLISIMVLSGFFILSVFLFNNKERVMNLYLVLLLASIIAACYQIGQFLFGAINTLWVFTLPSSLIGQWYESAIFFGFTAIVALVLLEFLSLKDIKIFKILLLVALSLSLLLVALVNFYYVWIAIGIVSFAVFMYGNVLPTKAPATTTSELAKKTGPLSVMRPSFVVFLISILFLTLATSNGLVSQKIVQLYAYFKVPFVEVRPGFQATALIAKGVLQHNALLGVGPNRFSNAWITYKPTEVNLSQFWNVDFNYGVGTLPTIFITSGLLGMLAWLVFIVGLLYIGVKASLATIASKDRLLHILIVLSTATSIYFWIFACVYVTQTVPMLLAFIFSGIMLSLASQADIFATFELRSLKNQKIKICLIALLVVLLVSSVSGFYLVLERAWGAMAFYRAIQTVNTNGDVTKGESLLAQAIQYNNTSDVYYRTLSNVEFVKLGQLLNNQNQSKDVLQNEFKTILQNTLANSQKAIALDPTNYLNYVSLGQIYESLISLKAEGAYDQARAQYNKAKELNPKNPSILFDLARLEMTDGNKSGARDYLSKSLDQKSNFSSALLVLAQIDAQEGRLDKAISRTEEAATAYPNDPTVFLQLGFYYYQNQNYEQAVQALSRVVALSPGNINANAQYFLGLSYDHLGDTTSALKEFEQIAVYNPDSQDIKNIISNLKAGRGATVNATPPPVVKTVTKTTKKR